MENKNNKLLQALRNSGAEKIFEAYHWLREHRQELNKEVYGPVLLEVFCWILAVLLVITNVPAYSTIISLGLQTQVNVSNRDHADYLEGHVPYYIWKVLSSHGFSIVLFLNFVCLNIRKWKKKSVLRSSFDSHFSTVCLLSLVSYTHACTWIIYCFFWEPRCMRWMQMENVKVFWCKYVGKGDTDLHWFYKIE